MKKTTTVFWMAAFIASVAVTASAQGPGGEGQPPPGPSLNASDLIAKYDTNDDSKLNAEELTTALDASRPPKPPSSFTENADRPEPPSAASMSADWIKRFDVDGDGSLSSDELTKAIQSHRPPGGNCPPAPPSDSDNGQDSEGR